MRAFVVIDIFDNDPHYVLNVSDSDKFKIKFEYLYFYLLYLAKLIIGRR